MTNGYSFSRADAIVLALLTFFIAGNLLVGCSGGDDGKGSGTKDTSQKNGNKPGNSGGLTDNSIPTGEPITIQPSAVVDLVDLPFSALGAQRATARRMQNGTQVRGIQQAMSLFSNGNNSFYPGIDGSTGKALANAIQPSNTQYGAAAPSNTDMSIVYAILMSNDYFTTDYAISPSDSDPSKIPAGPISESITNSHYSYALPQVGSDTGNKGRRAEWQDTINSQAPIVVDRSKAIDSALTTTSIHVKTKTTDSNDWSGNIAWNDNHVTFETTGIFPVGTIKIGTIGNDQDEDIFRADASGVMDAETNVMFTYGK